MVSNEVKKMVRVYGIIMLVFSFIASYILTVLLLGAKATFSLIIFLSVSFLITLWSGASFSKYKKIADNEIEGFYRPRQCQIDINSPVYFEKYNWMISIGYKHEYLSLHNAHIFKNRDNQICMSQALVDMPLEEFKSIIENT